MWGKWKMSGPLGGYFFWLTLYIWPFQHGWTDRHTHYWFCVLNSLAWGRAIKMSLWYRVSVCPSKFTHVQVGLSGFNGCYSFGSLAANWSAAAESCKSLHSNTHLVAIDNAAEETAVINLWTSHPGRPKPVDNHGSVITLAAIYQWHRHFANNLKQESCAVTGKPRDAVVIFQDGGRLLSWIWSN